MFRRKGQASLGVAAVAVTQVRPMHVTLMYGAKTPADMLYREELVSLTNRQDLNCLLTVDKDDTGTWKERVGLLPTLFDHVTIDASNTYAAVCGPPVVYKFVLQKLLE